MGNQKPNHIRAPQTQTSLNPTIMSLPQRQTFLNIMGGTQQSSTPKFTNHFKQQAPHPRATNHVISQGKIQFLLNKTFLKTYPKETTRNRKPMKLKTKPKSKQPRRNSRNQ